MGMFLLLAEDGIDRDPAAVLTLQVAFSLKAGLNRICFF